MALLKPCMKFKFFLVKRLFFRYYESVYTKNINNVFQGPPNTGFRSVKVQTETFLKKDLRYFQKYFLFRIPMKLWQAWKANLEGALFWVFKIVKSSVIYDIKGRFWISEMTKIMLGRKGKLVDCSLMRLQTIFLVMKVMSTFVWTLHTTQTFLSMPKSQSE